MQPDVHEHVAAEADARLVDERHVAIDVALVLERADAAQTCRLGQVHLRGELHVADAPVLLQGLEDRSVVFVQSHSRKLLNKLNQRQKVPHICQFVIPIAIKWRDLRGILSAWLETVGRGEIT